MGVEMCGLINMGVIILKHIYPAAHSMHNHSLGKHNPTILQLVVQYHFL